MMKRIGSLWKAKEGSKAVLNGVIEFFGEDIRVGIFKNDKAEGNQPPYNIVRYPEDKPTAPATEPEAGSDGF